MSASNDERDERVPGLENRSIYGKIVTALIFLMIGTGGVGYWMYRCKNCQPSLVENEQGPAGSDLTANANESMVQPATNLNLKPVSGDDPPRLKQLEPFNPSKTSIPDESDSQPNAFSGDQLANNSVAPPNSPPPASRTFSMPTVSHSANGQLSDDGDNDFGAGGTNTFPTASSSSRFQSEPKPLSPSSADQNPSTPAANPETGNPTINDLRSFGTSSNPASSSTKSDSNVDPGNVTGIPRSPSAFPTASYDTSKDLPPSLPAKTPDVEPAATPPSASLPPSVSPAANPFGSRQQTPFPAASPAASPVSGDNMRLVGNPTSIGNVSAASMAALPTPGDRNLEGLQSPSITIEKIAPAEIQVNKPANFQLVIKNVGRVTASQVRVMDQIPMGTEFIQSTPAPSRGPSNQISWDLDTLNPGQEKRINLQLRPTQPGEIGSVAQVSFSAQVAMRTRVTKPVLSIQHSVEPRILIGDPVFVNIEVKNEGDGPAHDVVIQEDLPEGLEFSEGYRELEYAVGTLGPGQSKNIRLELRAAKIGKYRNILVAHADGGLQTLHAVDLEIIAPRLEAYGDGPNRRYIQREASHRFAVKNVGTAIATNVELICRLPAGLKFISTNNRGKYDDGSHAVYWSLAELSPGLTANVELTTLPMEPGNQDLKFEVVSDLKQSAQAVCQLNVEQLIDIYFDFHDLVDPIEIGSETTYVVKIINRGTKTATNVQLQAEFPSGLLPTQVEGTITSEIRGQQIAFSPITNLNPNDQIEIKIQCRGITAGDHLAVVKLIADGREVNVSKQESTRVYSDR